MATETKEQAEPIVLRDENHQLTRAGMEQAIKGGGSVSYRRQVGTDKNENPVYQTRFITSIDQLPTPEELAQTPEEKAAAEKQLDEEIARMQARRAAIKTDDKPAPKK